jgi:hypothetical protein
MLKLEKIGKARQLNVRLRSKQTLLTAPFLLALGYAIFAHLLAFLLFHIAPLKIGNYPTLPPVRVEIYQPKASSAYAQALALDEAHGPTLPPELQAQVAAALPPLPLPFAMPPGAFFDEMLASASARPHAFLSAESNFCALNAADSLPIALHLSGAIAELNWHLDDQAERQEALLLAASKLQTGTYRFGFAVKVDQRRGEICWWRPFDRYADISKQLYHQVIDLLKEIRFATSNAPFCLSGEIEVAIDNYNHATDR